MRILVVEDDSLLADGLVTVLGRAGHTVYHTASGRYADALLDHDSYDLVVLDLGLPDIDGLEVLDRVRAKRRAVSVLVLTARDAVEERVRGLDHGADDYLTKPFSVNEFEARVRALERRIFPAGGKRSFGGLAVDAQAKRAKVNGTEVELTPREWALLELFMKRPGRVLSKEEIGETLFSPDEQPSKNAIEVHVSRLRAKIETTEIYIRTVRGFGYLWAGIDG
jgi:DNA-binding response OmpR family regulator